MKSNFCKLDSIGRQGAAIAATVVCLMTPAFRALSASDALQITENSSTSLSVLWNGVNIPALFIANDHWTVDLPVAVGLGTPGVGPGGGFAGTPISEPEAVFPNGPWNNLNTVGAVLGTVVDIQSDIAAVNGQTPPLHNNVPGQAGFDANGNAIILTFNDLGDGVGRVPDIASTAALLACAFGLLAGLRRKMTV